jgi:hypothetical protein
LIDQVADDAVDVVIGKRVVGLTPGDNPSTFEAAAANAILPESRQVWSLQDAVDCVDHLPD